MPQVFSNNRPIFPFTQCMAVALARARLGLLNTERVHPPGHDMIDELRAIIGMNAENREGGLGVGEPWNGEPAEEPGEAQGSLL